jgi:pimeloyl-ACP methyl ester carboxylesterase
MNDKKPLWRRLLRWTFLAVAGAIGLLVLAGVAGATWNARAARRDAQEFPQPGDSIDIGGRSLHLVCLGEGSPTVVIEGGAQDWSTGWRRPQEAIAEFTRVCSYDRAGLGWSDASPDPKDGRHMVADLHALLAAAEIVRPVVLVGHSLGGMLNQIYYQQYPTEVVGMVLAEPGDPDLVQEMFPDSHGVPAFGDWMDTAASLAARLGLLRYVYGDLMEGKGYPEREVLETRARVVLPDAAANLASTIRHLPVTAEQTRETTDLGDIPLVVVRSTKFDEVGTRFDDEAERQQFRRDSIEAWDQLATLSTRSANTVVVKDANHITLIRDDRYWPAVVEAIEQVVEEVRNRSNTS